MKIGIIGGGQLARMLILAGYPLGLEFTVFDPSPDACAFPLAKSTCAPYTEESLKAFALEADVITYEFENIPPEGVQALSTVRPLYPSPEALFVTRHRGKEKHFLSSLDIPVAPYVELHELEELKKAFTEFGGEGILKSSTLGYDGKGQIRMKGNIPFEAEALVLKGAVIEKVIPFNRELSLLVARSTTGQIAHYPLVQNVHVGGILHTTTAPAENISSSIVDQAQEIAEKILTAFQYVGILCIEFFEVDGKLLVNELAPRVHNSGHWTIEGAYTSQFEQHLRAITGLPLGSPSLRGYSGMLNLVSTLPEREILTALPNTFLHLYGKAPRDGRKLGHLTVVEESTEMRNYRMNVAIENLL